MEGYAHYMARYEKMYAAYMIQDVEVYTSWGKWDYPVPVPTVVDPD